MSMFGSGNSSFGHALLRFRKSTQHLICPFFFLTGTMFDSHFECSMGCIIGFTPGSTLRACATKLGSKPGISLYSQVKTSTYSFKSATSWVFSRYDRFALIEVIRRAFRLLLRLTTSNSTSAGKDRLGVNNDFLNGLATLSVECSAEAVVS